MSQPAIHLEGKVAIVTGASRGIGEAIARAFAGAGAKVVLAARKPEALSQVAESIVAAGGEAFWHAAHTGHPEECDALVRAAIERYGKVDVLVNNAATNVYFGPMLDTEWAAWDKIFEVNLKGYFAMNRAVARHLIERNAKGSLVQMASVAGIRAAPLQGVYGMTKAAVLSMTRTLAVELGSAGIRVNAIAPGLIDTRFSAALTTNDAIRDHVVSATPLGRVGMPEEIAGAALYLASDASSFVTGETLVVDGGWTIG